MSKIIAFKGTIRQFLNMVAVHIEGHRHSYFKYFFRVNVPLKMFKC
jgi:hypothetical protein